jgi:N-acetylmuramic acid 6-phosphate etherase
MSTEAYDPRSQGLDTWAPGDVLAYLHDGQIAAVAAVRAALPAMEAAANAALARLKRGGRLCYVGAGTSGRLAVQDGVELVPTFNWPFERLALIMAGGDGALLRSIEGVEDDETAGETAARAQNFTADDVLISIAASGTTRFPRRVQAVARSVGALTIAMANNRDAPLLREAEHAVLLDTGPEAIAGSTRMKAGTAQKVALNLFSTLLMIRLGRVHDGLMVDVQALNAKLVVRTVRMLQQLTGCDEATARDALTKAGGHVKTAVLVVRGLSADQARAALSRAEGSLRAALATIAQSRPT